MWPDGQANDPDLRHSFAAEAGASLQLIGKALVHTQIKTTERNTHLRYDPLQAMVDLGTFVAEILQLRQIDTLDVLDGAAGDTLKVPNHADRRLDYTMYLHFAF